MGSNCHRITLNDYTLGFREILSTQYGLALFRAPVKDYVSITLHAVGERSIKPGAINVRVLRDRVRYPEHLIELWHVAPSIVARSVSSTDSTWPYNAQTAEVRTNQN